ncbi:hypothetical protein DL96DRAFT_412537 [Flagelloscypha sp. PMI_526]|nr:hypothetical protein DL96DRAFT_412537 [Flagelloscypha sp. PMI_526]
MKLVPSFTTSLQSLTCRNLDEILPNMQNDDRYNRWFTGILDLHQYTSLTSFTGDLTFATLDYAEQRQPYIQRFARILRSGRPSRTSPGLRNVFIEVGFRSDDPHDPPFWAPIMEALATIATLEKVCFEIWHYTDDGISMYLPWKKVLEKALDAAGLLGKSEFIDFNGPKF